MLVSSPDEEVLEDDFAMGEVLLISDEVKVRRREADSRGTTELHARQQTGAITLCLSSIDFQRLAEAAKRSNEARFARDGWSSLAA